MKLSIVERSKKDIFISLFQVLKNCTNIVSIIFHEDHMYIQGMDRSHVCLFEVSIQSDWFTEYTVEKAHNICIDSTIFHNVLAITQENQSITLYYDSLEPDNVNIDMKSDTKTEYDKYFKIPLTIFETEMLSVPDTEYDVDFTIPAKKIHEITSQLMFFGDIMNIECTEEKISLGSSGVNGDMNVVIEIDDLSEYSISEGETIKVSYSLNYIHKMCITNKISNEVNFSVSDNYPMKIKYPIGSQSHLVFYIAPKINDD